MLKRSSLWGYRYHLPTGTAGLASALQGDSVDYVIIILRTHDTDTRWIMKPKRVQ